MNRGVTKGGDNCISEQCLQVLNLLSIYGYNPKKIAKYLKCSRKTFYKHYRIISKLALFNKFDGVTGGGDKLLCYHFGHTNYRINGAEVFYELPNSVNKIKWKRNKGRVLSLKHISHDNLSFGKENYERFYVDNCEVRCHSNGIKVYVPEIFGQSGSDAEHKFLIWIRQIGEKLNRIFKVDFFKDNQINVRIAKYELAHLNDALAKEMRREGNKLYINIDGELRYICDFSNFIDEGEAVTVDKSHADQENMVKYSKDILSKEHYLPSETKAVIDNILNQNTLLAQQIEAHLLVVNEMKDLTKTLKKYFEEKKGI